MVIIALGNGHYDLKILRSLFRATKETLQSHSWLIGSQMPTPVLPEETSEVLIRSEVVGVAKVANN